MYEKEILELEDVRQVLQNNKLMKKTVYREGLRLVIKERRGRSKSRGPKKGTIAFSKNNDCYYCK